MADLSTIKPAALELEIKHPGTGDRLGVRLTLISMDDQRMIKIKRGITDNKLRLDARGKHFKAEDIEDNTNRLYFGATTGWEWYNPTGNVGDDGYDADAMPEIDGEQPDFNQRNFMMVVTKLPWFAEQIGEALGNSRDFFKK